MVPPLIGLFSIEKMTPYYTFSPKSSAISELFLILHILYMFAFINMYDNRNQCAMGFTLTCCFAFLSDHRMKRDGLAFNY